MKKFSKVVKNNRINLYKQAARWIKQAGEVYSRIYFDTPITLTENVQYYLPWTISF